MSVHICLYVSLVVSRLQRDSFTLSWCVGADLCSTNSTNPMIIFLFFIFVGFTYLSVFNDLTWYQDTQQQSWNPLDLILDELHSISYFTCRFCFYIKWYKFWLTGKGCLVLKNASPTLEEGVLMEKAFCFGGVVLIKEDRLVVPGHSEICVVSGSWKGLLDGYKVLLWFSMVSFIEGWCCWG